MCAVLGHGPLKAMVLNSKKQQSFDISIQKQLITYLAGVPLSVKFMRRQYDNLQRKLLDVRIQEKLKAFMYVWKILKNICI